MSDTHGPYHRLGEPGGAGCPLTAIPVAFKDSGGTPISGHLLSAEEGKTEIEMLRTVAKGLGVRWGHDTLGWWAVVPDSR